MGITAEEKSLHKPFENQTSFLIQSQSERH